MSSKEALSRRGFLKIATIAGTGLVIGCYLPGKKAESKGSEGGAVFQPNVFVKVEQDGTVTLTVSKSDMGQGVRTSLAMILADEMDVDWHKVKVEQAQANEKYGGQGTGGSSSIRSMWGPLRNAGAAARAMLLAAAAQTWGCAVADCKTVDGSVEGPGGKKLSYGELSAKAAEMPLPDPSAVKLKDPNEYDLIGKPTKKVDGKAIVTGKAKYGLDCRPAGVKVAVIARPNAFGGQISSFDEAAAKAVPAVHGVFQVPSGIAVVADNTWAALQGRKALNAQSAGGDTSLDSARIKRELQAQTTPFEKVTGAAKVVEARFDFPYLAHATMEPMNCVIVPKGGQAEVWAPTQVPEGALRTVANGLGLAPENVTLNVTLLGGGFGRRLQTDFLSEAASVAKAAGMPIQLMWSREDDMRHDFYRPACHAYLMGALDAQGNPILWQNQMITAGGGRGGRPGRRGSAGIPYDIAEASLTGGGAGFPVPTGAWRSVENTLTGFINESFIDMLAAAAGKDGFEFRRGLIKNARLRNCLEVAAQKAGWGTPLPKGSGRGISCFAGYGSYIAHVVELSVDAKGKVHLHRVVCAVDCGTAINPSGIEAQVQGATVDGLSTALKAAITIDKGAVVQGSWDTYPWLTMNEMPKIEVTIIPSQEGPGGMGEVGFPATAPAVANAIFAATGKRVTHLPIKPSDLV